MTCDPGRRSVLAYVIALAICLKTVILSSSSLKSPTTFLAQSSQHDSSSSLAFSSSEPLWMFDVLGSSTVLPAVAVPAIVMCLGGLLAGKMTVSGWGLCASQYFSAGMILAVCGSLAKELCESGLRAAIVVSVGFALGIGTMIFVKKVSEAYGGDGGDLVKGFPWPLTIAVGIDSLVDGLLLGMIAVETPRAVLMMSTATALEMGALGLSYAASIREQKRRVRAACVLGMPLVLMLGGIIGSLAAAPLKDSPLAVTGMMSFGIAALVYLVTQELLAEADEKREEVDEKGTTSWFLFAGYLLVLVLETVEAEG
eukprot:TRINITY_DN75905_c0_g1_i1.p1 TRINITY_DN75905_c0_g1~~TRINITY_DN75905_c0_g1_i1.p1  ORF type:complete len:312 (+),score=63.76 TRINITY_DN75905_c0_g1_i1:67-1002(+)